MSKTKWLDRRISAPGPYLCLCLSEGEYKKALREVGVEPIHDWLKTPQADATAHHMRSPKGLCVVICLGEHSTRTPIEIAGLLVHEAVHAWQEWCEYYGENPTAREQEAYAIQSISQELMSEFARRIQL